jgi:hypothetical protein
MSARKIRVDSGMELHLDLYAKRVWNFVHNEHLAPTKLG